MHDEIAHLRVVDAALRFGLPGCVSGCVVRVDSDDVDLFQIFEFMAGHARQLAAEHEVEQLLRRLCFWIRIRHALRSSDRADTTIQGAARRGSFNRLRSAACLSWPAATSIPCRGTARL